MVSMNATMQPNGTVRIDGAAYLGLMVSGAQVLASGKVMVLDALDSAAADHQTWTAHEVRMPPLGGATTAEDMGEYSNCYRPSYRGRGRRR